MCSVMLRGRTHRTRADFSSSRVGMMLFYGFFVTLSFSSLWSS